jgi:hypothetical protein
MGLTSLLPIIRTVVPWDFKQDLYAQEMDTKANEVFKITEVVISQYMYR